MSPASEAARAVPAYALYGEQAALPDLVHVEPLAARAPRLGWRIAPHRHPGLHQFLLLRSGAASWFAEGAWRVLAPGQAVSVPAGAAHGFRFRPGSAGLVVTVPARVLDEALARAPEAAAVLARPLALPADAPLAAALEGLEQAWSGTGPGRAAELCAWLTLIGVRAARAARAGRERDLIARFEALLEREFARRHAVGWYARALGVSSTHLSRLCRARHGASARALIARRVMREARRLLLYTERSVAEVAEAVGFADPNHFSRAFARATGQPPTAFRRAARRALAPDGGAP